MKTDLTNTGTTLERTLVLIKPDALQRGLVGEVFSRLEKKGLRIAGVKMLRLDRGTLGKLYSHLSDKPFFPRIEQFMASSPILATCWEGVDCAQTVRRIAGDTLSRQAAPGTIRGDLAMSVQCNLVHSSENREQASRELELFFQEQDLFSYETVLLPLVYSKDELETS